MVKPELLDHLQLVYHFTGIALARLQDYHCTKIEFLHSSYNLAIIVGMNYFFYKGMGWTNGGECLERRTILCFDMEFL